MAGAAAALPWPAAALPWPCPAEAYGLGYKHDLHISPLFILPEVGIATGHGSASLVTTGSQQSGLLRHCCSSVSLDAQKMSSIL
jgi:hypothetical protein